jgi:DNA replication protein DnaC
VRKTKEVLRLRFEVGLGLRQIARSCSIGLGTVHEYLQRAEAAGVTWPLGEDWDEERLEAALFGGPTGVGKSFVACALAQKACRDGYSALYARAQSLFRDLAMARADGSLRSLLTRLSRIDVLVIDDWAMAPLSEPERRDFWEICEDRYQVRSTILTSQLPVSRWHEQIGDPTLADGILDRLVHNAHRIEMRGDSMRKNRGKPNA